MEDGSEPGTVASDSVKMHTMDHFGWAINRMG